MVFWLCLCVCVLRWCELLVWYSQVLVWLLFCCFGFACEFACLFAPWFGWFRGFDCAGFVDGRLLRGIWLLLIWGCLRLLVRSFVSVVCAGWFDVLASVVLLGWACLRMLVLRVWYNVVQFSWWSGFRWCRSRVVFWLCVVFAAVGFSGLIRLLF